MAKGGNFSNGGIGGSGVFGMVGSVTVCQSTDNSFYCVVSRYFSLFTMFVFFSYILYVFYTLVIYPLMRSKKGR